MWTVEYKATERGPWVPTGITADDADAAWFVFTLHTVANDLDYHTAQAFPTTTPALVASLAGRARKC